MNKKEKEVKQAFEKLYKNWSDIVEKPPKQEEIQNKRNILYKMQEAFADLKEAYYGK